ncbi:MAG: tol-pal system protein YbgF [Candidatus Binatia bacterium]
MNRLLRTSGPWPAVLLFSVALAGCATRADLLQVKDDQRETRALLADQQVAIDGLRRRLEMLRSDLAEPGRRKSGAPPSNEALQQLNDLSARVAALEQARAGAPAVVPSPFAQPEVEAPPPPVAAAPPPEVAPTPAPPKPLNPQDAAITKEEAALQGAHVDSDYREGLGLIRQGQCNQAVPKLRDFIRKNPKSDFADDAQYWIGSCYYGQHDYNRAILELNEVLLKYPKADKVPAALLMLADAFADSGDKIDARLILQKLVSDHPKSDEAERGRQKLQSLGG